MIYIKDDNKIKKYLIEIEESKLRKVRVDIIDNCSHIIHKKDRITCYECCDLTTAHDEDPLKIRNYKKEEDNYNEYIYNVEYDLYEYPPIIKQIDVILKTKDEKKIYNLLNYLNEMVIEKKVWKKILKQGNYMGSDKLNGNRKPVGYYYYDLINCINFTYVEEIDCDEFDKIYNFIDGENINKNNKLLLVKGKKWYT